MDEPLIRRFIDELQEASTELNKPAEASRQEGVALLSSAALGKDEPSYGCTEPDAHTLQLQTALGLERPYSLSDVEPLAHEQMAKARDKLSAKIPEGWAESASLQTNVPLALPMPSGAVTTEEVSAAMLGAQLLRNPEKRYYRGVARQP